MEEPPPFDLVPLDDGRYELRAFSDDSDDPIVMTLDPESGGRLAAALRDALVSLNDPEQTGSDFHVPVGQRVITITTLSQGRLRLTVTRGSN